MILLHHIVQILTLTQPTATAQYPFRFEGFDRG